MNSVKMFSLDEVVKRLSDRNLKIVSQKSGVAYQTLRLLAIGKTKRPNYMDMDRLREYFSGAEISSSTQE
tara:strand:+ start:3234 stop:3443 length:210 start_codon:yes stop_codon:yes gene_type:complete